MPYRMSFFITTAKMPFLSNLLIFLYYKSVKRVSYTKTNISTGRGCLADISAEIFILVNIHFICHMLKAHDLRKTRIYTINTALKKNQSSINQHRIYIIIQWYSCILIKACILTLISRYADQEIYNKLKLKNRIKNSI